MSIKIIWESRCSYVSKNDFKMWLEVLFKRFFFLPKLLKLRGLANITKAYGMMVTTMGFWRQKLPGFRSQLCHLLIAGSSYFTSLNLLPIHWGKRQCFMVLLGGLHEVIVVKLWVQCLVRDKHLIRVRHYHIKRKERIMNIGVSVPFLFLLR